MAKAQKPEAQAPKAEEKEAAGGALAPLQADAGSLVVIGDQMPDYLREEGQQSTRGNENVGADDLVIPRLEIVQGLSPQLVSDHKFYNPQAKQGQMFNSATQRLYGSDLFLVPIMFLKLWLVWKDRKQGGGFLGSFANPTDANNKAEAEGGKAAGIEVLDTPTHYCLLIDRQANTVEEIMVSMPRTKAKVSRAWNTMIRLAGGDRFSRIYRVSTALEKNSRGQSYYNFALAQCGFPQKTLRDHALKIYEQLKSGERKVVMDTSGIEPGEHEEVEQETEM